jgi:hypothetical protein
LSFRLGSLAFCLIVDFAVDRCVFFSGLSAADTPTYQTHLNLPIMSLHALTIIRPSYVFSVTGAALTVPFGSPVGSMKKGLIS